MCLFKNKKIEKFNNNLLEILNEFFNKLGSNKKGSWKPSIVKISRVALNQSVTNAIRESKVKINNSDVCFK